ncbi:MAG: hypothetical protein WD342_20320 [Verrucomicrobiales bacterium]
MKIERDQLYLIGGLGMIVGSFFAAAKALGGIVTVICFFAVTDFSSVEPSIQENVTNSIMAQHMSDAVYGIASFLILFFGARWLISEPRFIDRWIDRNGRKPVDPENPANKSSHSSPDRA